MDNWINWVLIAAYVLVLLYLARLIIDGSSHGRIDAFRTSIKQGIIQGKIGLVVVLYLTILILFAYSAIGMLNNTPEKNIVKISIFLAIVIYFKYWSRNSAKMVEELLKKISFGKNIILSSGPFIAIKNNDFEMMTVLYGVPYPRILEKIRLIKPNEYSDSFCFAFDFSKNEIKHTSRDIDLNDTEKKRVKNKIIVHPLIEKIVKKYAKNSKLSDSITSMDIRSVVLKGGTDGYTVAIWIKKDAALTHPKEVYDLLVKIKREIQLMPTPTPHACYNLPCIFQAQK